MSDKVVDTSVLGFATYEDYVNSFSTKNDIRYLGNIRVAGNLAKLGYRSTKTPYSEKEFVKRVDLAMLAIRPKITGIQPFSRFMSPDNTDPVLLEFKRREVPIFSKILATIVFARYTAPDSSDVSAYLDLGMSWQNTVRRAIRHTNWKGVYEGSARLLPMSHHLSYNNPRYNMLNYTDSDNFCVIHDHRYGLMFKHRGDHKYIPVGGSPTPFDKNVKRSISSSPKYGTMIFYDHTVRKKV
ncbi:cilia- and flagella-associated protein 299 [Drosophila grimshawi]|uniref:Cilia- and flagella-associated protein 299 n=1 Tax=Drosophila grimshawi TaxID=7222 RepID=B4JC46_DROGR|nr:cilia- and flagella-associated protein 299 [Drosophila grimshawi]EDW03059.1 GH10702 [Drosophila grimshawi]